MIDLQFKDVSKKYLVRQQVEPDQATHPLVRKWQSLRLRKQEFWAVRNVSFEVERGEALGIIGPNGAGKSTILKLLSNITAPTSGEITINGRLSALIEVGSGFHPELTGRENIFLSGSIMGMRRREIAAKLDRILEFAGVRRFIDVPVKRYSSGMYVRLGFAIAAHLDPDILLLDEVLAVGDSAFQAKCLTRIKELQLNGTTIVFISHDLNAVERLCDRVLLIQEGQIKSNGPAQEVIEQYKRVGATLNSTGPRGLGPERKWQDLKAAPCNEVVRLRSIRVRTEDGQTASAVDIREPVGIELVYDVLQPGHILVPNYHFFNEERLHLFAVQEVGPSWRRRPRPVGQYVSTAWIPGNFFSESGLTIDVAVSSHIPAAAVHVMEHDAVAFRVRDSLEKDSARGDYTGPMPGLIRPMVDWTTHFSPCGEITEPGVEELNTV